MKRIFPLLLWAALMVSGCRDAQPAKNQAEVTASEPEITDTLSTDTTTRPLPDFEKAASIGALEQTMIDSGLVDIQTLDSTLLVDLKYSTTDNFIGVDVYGELTRCYLRPLAAEKLAKAAEYLREAHPGYRLKVFDGCRPRRVSFMMWDTLKIPNKINYVANPWEGSIHNYGMAVDLTAVDENGQDLDMGTEFDFFGELAQPQLEQKMLSSGKLTEAQYANRQILYSCMKKAGFYPIKTEWWHFVALLSHEVKAQYHMIE